MSGLVVNLFAGPGGGCLGARAVGLDPIGIELDETVCATRAAAGLRTIRADVAVLPVEHLAGRVWGLLGSPPCQSFSAAGKGAGRGDLLIIFQGAADLAAGRDTRAELAAHAGDPRSLLVLEPLRWARDTRPEWVALEQVPPVLGLWRRYAEVLRGWGYSTWAGLINSADHGVPQTRVRAILMASRARRVAPPEPTHSDQRRGGSLLGLKPWVSMAQALGMYGTLVSTQSTELGGGERRYHEVVTDRPSPTIMANTDRWTVKTNQRSGWVATASGNDDAHDYERSLDRPAPSVTGRADRWTLRTNRDQRPDGSRQVVESDRPAPTLTGKSGGQWQLSTIFHARGYDRSIPRTIDEPAPTLSFGHAAASWAFTRPATTVLGTNRVGRPGHKDREAGEAQYEQDTVRITVEQAAVLQGFPPDHPFAGNKTQRFQQVGDAFPPPVAAAVVRALTGGAS